MACGAALRKTVSIRDSNMAFPGGSGGGGGGEDDLYEGFGYSIDAPAPAAPGTAVPGAPPPAFGSGVTFNPAMGATGGAMAPIRGPPSRMRTGRLGTGAGAGADGRPMTSVTRAGYTSAGRPPTSGVFDPLKQRAVGPAPPLAEKSDHSPEDHAREMEKQVNALIEASAEAAVSGDSVMALERAKAAGKKERQLCKHRESNGLVDQINMDLTYAVCFNLANAYHSNGMHSEAINTYSLIVKNKQYPQSGRLRVNMGNIYFEEKKYPLAIKMYRMALDQIPTTGADVRLKIMRNIGNAFVKLGQFSDAIQSYEAIMDANPEFQTGFNLIVCYYALGDADRMRKGFSKLLAIPPPAADEEDEDEGEAETKDGEDTPAKDSLKEELSERQKQASRFITIAAKLIAPTLDPKNWVAGFDWVIEALRHEHDLVASELLITKALTYLRNKQFEKAVEVLKSFEKKDTALKAKAATNLSFLYFLEGDIAQADKYANLAVRHDRYNAKALVNKGNCLNMQSEKEKAKELYLEAIGVEADCIEAIYNLGLVNKELGNLSESLQAFEKLHTIIPSSPEVIYQIANLHDLMGHYRAASKYFNYLISKVPSDPGALARLGQIFAKDDDETQAFHYHHEAFRYYPVDLDVISWLGVWYVKSELYEKASEFFQRASEIQPLEAKWRLMQASCARRMGAYQKAMDLYESINKKFPDNIECLRYLCALSKDLGRDHSKYEAKLLQLERSAPAATRATFAPTPAPAPAAAPAAPAPDSPGGRAPDSPTSDGPMGAPSHQAKLGSAGPAFKDDDDFADADLDDLLAD